MAPRTTKPAGDDNAAPEVLAEATEVPVATPEAEETGGAKLIRVRNGVFHLELDGGAIKVDGSWQEFAATKAKAVIEAARKNGVRLAVADKKG